MSLEEVRREIKATEEKIAELNAHLHDLYRCENQIEEYYAGIN